MLAQADQLELDLDHDRDGFFRQVGVLAEGQCDVLPNGHRSEEHTSELQSRQYLVCRLLLEKKKKKTNYSSQTVIRARHIHPIVTIVQHTYAEDSLYLSLHRRAHTHQPCRLCLLNRHNYIYP